MATLTFNDFLLGEFETTVRRARVKPRARKTRSTLGQSVLKYRGCTPQMNRPRLAKLVGLSEKQLTELETGHRNAYRLPLATLHAIAHAINTTVTIVWKDPQRRIPCTEKTTVGCLIRRSAEIELCPYAG
jgi:hypothetical protein